MHTRKDAEAWGSEDEWWRVEIVTQLNDGTEWRAIWKYGRNKVETTTVNIARSKRNHAIQLFRSIFLSLSLPRSLTYSQKLFRKLKKPFYNVTRIHRSVTCALHSLAISFALTICVYFGRISVVLKPSMNFVGWKIE